MNNQSIVASKVGDRERVTSESDKRAIAEIVARVTALGYDVEPDLLQADIEVIHGRTPLDLAALAQAEREVLIGDVSGMRYYLHNDRADQPFVPCFGMMPVSKTPNKTLQTMLERS